MVSTSESEEPDVKNSEVSVQNSVPDVHNSVSVAQNSVTDDQHLDSAVNNLLNDEMVSTDNSESGRYNLETVAKKSESDVINVELPVHNTDSGISNLLNTEDTLEDNLNNSESVTNKTEIDAMNSRCDSEESQSLVENLESEATNSESVVSDVDEYQSNDKNSEFIIENSVCSNKNLEFVEKQLAVGSQNSENDVKNSESDVINSEHDIERSACMIKHSECDIKSQLDGKHLKEKSKSGTENLECGIGKSQSEVEDIKLGVKNSNSNEKNSGSAEASFEELQSDIEHFESNIEKSQSGDEISESNDKRSQLDVKHLGSLEMNTKKSESDTNSGSFAKDPESNDKISEFGTTNSESNVTNSESNVANSGSIVTNLEPDAKISESDVIDLESDANISGSIVTNLESDNTISECNVTNLESDAKKSEPNCTNLELRDKVSEHNAEKANSNVLISESSAKTSESDVTNTESENKNLESDAVKLGSDDKTLQNDVNNLETHGKKSETNVKKPESSSKQMIRVSALGRDMARSSTYDISGSTVTFDRSGGNDSPIISPSGRPQRKAAKKAESQIREIVAETESTYHGSLEDVEMLSEESMQLCFQCGRVRGCKYLATSGYKTVYVCSDTCLSQNQKLYIPADDQNTYVPLIEQQNTYVPLPEPQNTYVPQPEPQKSYIPPYTVIKPSPPPPKPDETDYAMKAINLQRKCAQCGLHNIVDKKSLSWQTMDFCNEDCLSRYQIQLGSHCAKCNEVVHQTCLGKYCVRFGVAIKQFCDISCLLEFKKCLKICGYCQKDISTDALNLPVGNTGQFKDFCSMTCGQKYERLTCNTPATPENDVCIVCNQLRQVKLEVVISGLEHKLCSEICFAAFKFKNQITNTERCSMCKKYYDDSESTNNLIFFNEEPHGFCSKTCSYMYILNKRKIIECNWCKVKKYNFDMIRKSTIYGTYVLMCSLTCITMYQVSVNACTTRKIKCDHCKTVEFAQYHLAMSDTTIRNFCSYNCVMTFQNRYTKPPLSVHDSYATAQPVPLGLPKRITFQKPGESIKQPPVVEVNGPLPNNKFVPVTSNCTPPSKVMPTTASVLQINNQVGNNQMSNHISRPAQIEDTAVLSLEKYVQQILIEPPALKLVKNKSIQTHVITSNKHSQCNVVTASKRVQTEKTCPDIITIPVPIYVPVPLPMYTTPFPVPVPLVIPVPFPVFIPTTKNSYKEIMAEMTAIQEGTPADPLEADILMMARRAEEENKKEQSNNSKYKNDKQDGASVNPIEEDILLMARRAEEDSRIDEVFKPEYTLDKPTGIHTSPSVNCESDDLDNSVPNVDEHLYLNTNEDKSDKRKRNNDTSSLITKKLCRSDSTDTLISPALADSLLEGDFVCLSSSFPIPPIDPDAHPSLKRILGLTAWHQWIVMRQDKMESQGNCDIHTLNIFKKHILQLKSEDLNDLLCLFIKEVRKPTGKEYAPDTIYYLCLGIQQYLYENGRVDSIFIDPFYEKFTDTLNDLAIKFGDLYGDTKYIVTRVEEEHLWESRQLGAHSPQVLLTSVMFFNTKHFKLGTVEDHLSLAFPHILKYWKRTYVNDANSAVENSNENKTASTKDEVVLRFYPPQSTDDFSQIKYMEQHGIGGESLRCPIKLFEFYLSKCPESVKNRNDVFYLQPEKSCLPNSPIWFSSIPLAKEPLSKMLNRIKLVKEINLSLLGK